MAALRSAARRPGSVSSTNDHRRSQRGSCPDDCTAGIHRFVMDCFLRSLWSSGTPLHSTMRCTDVLFKLRVNEKELLDEWVAQTTLTRSGFVTELLVLELE